MESLKRATIRAMNRNLPPNTIEVPTGLLADSVTACVLAGGRGQRLGERNKGLLPWPKADSSPLISTVLQRLEGQVREIVISANADISEYKKYGYAVVGDAPEFAESGPLAGLLMAGETARSDWLLSAAVDSPRLPLDIVARLLTAGAEIAVAHDGERLQPLSMLICRQLLPRLRQYLLGGGRSVYGWLENNDFATVDFSDQPLAFINLNTEEDFKAHQ